MKSMTAFGRRELIYRGRQFIIEAKSLNHRYMEVRVRLPKEYSQWELAVVRTVQERFLRGRFEIVLEEDTHFRSKAIKLNLPLAKAYIKELKRLKASLGLNGEIGVSELLEFKDIFSHPEELSAGSLWKGINRALNGALRELDRMRMKEGVELKKYLLERLRNIQAMLLEVEAMVPQTVKDCKERLKQRISKLVESKKLDPFRLEQEVALFADRTDVTEETSRLRSHLKHFKELTKKKAAVGRELDFILQEMNREANTIGSKASNSAISSKIVELKSELERMREQVQNIE